MSNNIRIAFGMQFRCMCVWVDKIFVDKVIRSDKQRIIELKEIAGERMQGRPMYQSKKAQSGQG